MTTTLGADLRSRRLALGLTQQEVADRLGVSRPNVAQWERGTHSPSPDRLRRLDDLYRAGGTLLELGSVPRDDSRVVLTGSTLRISEVFQHVADALVAALRTDDEGRPLGWGHNLGDPDAKPTALSTAYVIRTLQRLDDSRVDLHALSEFLLQTRQKDGGWSNRFAVGSRPEVTAVVITCLARLGRLPEADQAIGHLVDRLDRFAESRPFILTAVLDALLVGRPETAVVERVVRALLAARTDGAGPRLWVVDASAPARLIVPNLAPTARAGTLLCLARRIVDDPGLRSEMDEAIDAAARWVVDLSDPEWGTTETLRIENSRGHRSDVTIHHFTAAWCARFLCAAGVLDGGRLDEALAALWKEYQPDDGLWSWTDDGTLPSWMTHDAVAALRSYALTSTGSALVAPLPRPRSPEADSDSSSTGKR